MPTSISSRCLAVLLAALFALPAAAADRSISTLMPPAVPLDGPAVSAAPGLTVDPSAGVAAMPVSVLPAAETSISGSPSQAAAAVTTGGGAAAQAAPGSTSRQAALDAEFDGLRPAAEIPDGAEAVFAAAHPVSQTLATVREAARGRGTFSDFANAMIFDDLFSHLAGHRAMGEQRVPFGYPNRAAHVKAIDEILSFADSADSDPLARRFVAALAKEKARQAYERARHRPDFAEDLPANPLHHGEYWDFATGPNGGRLMLGQKDSSTQYRFIDQSAYVVDYLNEIKRLALADGEPVANVQIMQADVRRMARPPTPLSVIRSKNVHTYVAGFENELEKMSDWIAPGGALVLQNDPGGQRPAIVNHLGPMIERLLAQGWTLRFDGFSHEPDRLETLTLTRPASAGAKPEQASAKVWKKYVDDVRSMGMGGGMDIHALLRMLSGR